MTARRVVAASAVGAILALGLSLRAVSLDSDPPSYWVFGTAWGDEGPWNWAAAHRATTGKWPLAGERFLRVGPLYLGVQAQIFKALGTDLIRARLVSVVAGVSTLVVVMYLAWHVMGRRAAWLAGLCYATLFWAVAFERLATPDAFSVSLAVLALAVLYRARGPSAELLALSLSGLAAAAKLGAVFAPVFIIAAAVLLRGIEATTDTIQPRARARMAAVGSGVAAILMVTVLVLFIIRAVPTLRSSGWWFPRSETALSAYAWRFLIAPFHAEFFLRMPVAVVGVFLLALPANQLHGRARRLAILSAVWIGAWWVVVPISNLKGARYYLLAVPLTLLGSIGWTALQCNAGTHRTARRFPLPVSLLLAWLWMAALLAVWLSPRTAVRAAIWLALIVPSSFPILLRVARANLRESARGGVRRWEPAILALVVLSQLGPHLEWFKHRSRLVATALSRFAAMDWRGGDLCGAEAPTLMLARPGAGEALYQVDFPDCRHGSRVADYLVLAEKSGCSPFEGEWISLQRSHLPALREVGVVDLPFDPVGGPRGRCRYRIVSVDSEVPVSR